MHVWHRQAPVAVPRRCRLRLGFREAAIQSGALVRACALWVAFGPFFFYSGRCAFADGKGRVVGTRHREIGGARAPYKRRDFFFLILLLAAWPRAVLGWGPAQKNRKWRRAASVIDQGCYGCLLGHTTAPVTGAVVEE